MLGVIGLVLGVAVTAVFCRLLVLLPLMGDSGYKRK